MLVVNPSNRLRSKFSAIEPPLWAGLTAAYHNADILDAEALGLTIPETAEAIRNTGHKDILIVVMGNNPSVSSTPKMPVAEALADQLDGLNVTLTGIHPIAAGSRYPVINRPFEGTPDIQWYKLPMKQYRAHNWHCLDGSPRSPYASVYTSLGCPFNCYYCNVHTLYEKRGIVYRPVEAITKEIDTLVFKYGVSNIKFWDELFALEESRVVEICGELKHYDLNIWAYARVDTITKGMLKAMKAAGINWLAYGFESVKDKKFTTRTTDVIKMTKDAGINIIGNFMFGLPGDTPETMRQTLDFAKEQLFEYVNFYVARPYPGSRWYEDTKPDMTPADFDQYGNNRMLFRDMAFNEYFINPAYVEMINKKFGAQAVKHIQEMLDADR